jgi:IclR family acetate operon transcriptional repressor
MSNRGTAPKEGLRPTYLIESVDSALRLLHMFLVRPGIRVSEAAAELKVAPSTAHRLLAMLQYHGFVTQDARTHEYVQGPDLISFGLAMMRKLDIRQQARPIMESLREVVKETVALGVLEGTSVLYVDGVESGLALRVAARTGALLPAHSMAMGKALLAWLPEEQIDELFPSEILPQVTDRTLLSKSELLVELAAIRRRGYAQSRGESEAGVASIAVPVLDELGRVQGSISIASPAFRATAEHIKSWLPPLRAAADELAKKTRSRLHP